MSTRLGRSGSLATLTALAVLCLAGRPAAQEGGGGEGGGEGGTPAEQEGGDTDEEKDDEKNAKYFAIVGGDVHTGTGAVLRGATLLARNGKIVAIGYDVFVPEGAEKLAAEGLRVYPGLIALGATSRLTAGTTAAEGEVPEEPLEPEHEIMWDGLLPVPVLPVPGLNLHVGAHPDDGFQADEEDEEAKNEVEDTFDPFNSFLVLALATGITSVQQSTAAVKLKRYEIEGVLLSDRHLATIPWDLGNPTGIHATRQKFAKAAEYVRAMRAWRERNNKNEKEPSKKGVDTTAFRVLSGDALAHFRVSAREELLGIARLAQEHRFRPVIEGCEEGWTVADELGRAGAYAILTPRSRQPKQERFVRPGGSTIENAALLFRSGVQVAVRPASTTIDMIGTAGRDLLALPIEAGFAVRGGLSNEAALAAMTIVPARVLGIDHRVGTLEVGKDCDVIVTDGDILHYQTFVQYTVVDAKLVYDKEKEIYFAHIRPRPKKAEPPAAAPVEEESVEPSKEAEPAAEEPAKDSEDPEKEPDDVEKDDVEKDDEKKDDEKKDDEKKDDGAA